MIELEVIQDFNYSKYNNLSKITSKGEAKTGTLFVGDKIVVSTQEEADYLCGNNNFGFVGCKVIEKKEEVKTVNKPKRKKTK